MFDISDLYEQEDIVIINIDFEDFLEEIHGKSKGHNIQLHISDEADEKVLNYHVDVISQIEDEEDIDEEIRESRTGHSASSFIEEAALDELDYITDD